MTDAYEIGESVDGVVVLRFAEYVDQIRRPSDDDQGFDLVDRNEVVICDLSATVDMVSRWLKLLVRMTDRAEASGKRVVLVGVQESVRRTSDWLGLKNAFTLADSIDEALEP